MINIEKILEQDRQIRATTGLNQQAFEALLPSFAEAYQETLDKKRRWRAGGGGRKATLKTSADKLFFILLYCKCYPTYSLPAIKLDIKNQELALRREAPQR
jgi:hypothetical protein